MIFELVLCVLPPAALVVACVALNKMSMRFAFVSILAGILPVIPIMALQLVVFPAFSSLDARLGTRLLSALILNGLIEEAIKFLCLLILPRKNTPLSTLLAGGAAAGLTLGAFESVVYFVVGFERVLLRLATAALIHTLCAMLSSLCLASFARGKKNSLPLALAVITHGVYNFFAGFTGIFWAFSIAAILFAAIECRVQYTHLQKNAA
jgi:RsiW-degrading membrane proteinase PrsW (M82 family)